jgi:hypothetical protein
MSTTTVLAPLLTASQLQSDLHLLSLQPDLLDPFLPAPTKSSTHITTSSSSTEPTQLPTSATESLDYARRFIQSTRKIVGIAEGENPGRAGQGRGRGALNAGLIEGMGRRLGVVDFEVKGLSKGLEGI